jgi:hypothetical protein
VLTFRLSFPIIRLSWVTTRHFRAVVDVFVAERRSMFGSSRRPCPGHNRSFTGLDVGCGVDEMPVGRGVDETLPEVVCVAAFV